MPPFETREKPAPEVWLEDSTWIDTRRSRSRDDAPVDPVVITVSAGDELPDVLPPFYDHAADDGTDGPRAAGRAHGAATPTEVAAVRRAAAASRTTFTPAAPAGEVPGLLRRPLVEVQRTPPRERDEVDRPRVQRPDRIALLAIALALITLLSAVITAQG